MTTTRHDGMTQHRWKAAACICWVMACDAAVDGDAEAQSDPQFEAEPEEQSDDELGLVRRPREPDAPPWLQPVPADAAEDDDWNGEPSVVAPVVRVEAVLDSRGRRAIGPGGGLPVVVTNLAPQPLDVFVDVLVADDASTTRRRLGRRTLAPNEAAELAFVMDDAAFEGLALTYSGQVRFEIARANGTGNGEILGITEPVYFHVDAAGTALAYDRNARDRDFGFGDYRNAGRRASQSIPWGGFAVGVARPVEENEGGQDDA